MDILFKFETENRFYFERIALPRSKDYYEPEPLKKILQELAAEQETILARKPAKLYPGHGRPFDCSALEKNKGKIHTMRRYPLSNKK